MQIMFTDPGHYHIGSINTVQTVDPWISFLTKILHLLNTDNLPRKAIDHKKIFFARKYFFRCVHKHIDSFLTVLIFHLLIKVEV